jgi:hypothetical protein
MVAYPGTRVGGIAMSVKEIIIVVAIFAIGVWVGKSGFGIGSLTS